MIQCDQRIQKVIMLRKLLTLALMMLLLFFSACSYKRTQTSLNEGNLTAFTAGDYEIAQVAKELSNNLSIPLQEKDYDTNQSIPLDEVTLIKGDASLCIILNGKIFQKNKAIPIENAIYIVQEITDIIKKYPHIIIQVTGHTDTKEETKKHQDLSDNRAISIAEILYKLDAKNETYAKGCADKKPLYSDTSKDDALSNARVEIYLYANKEKMVDHCK